jgi:acetyltransferase-like isoleucine patch superfamily enzyme
VTVTTLDHDWFPVPVPDNVLIGGGSWVHSAYAFLRCRSTRPVAVHIGRHTGVYAWSSFELGPNGSVEIGDHCTITEVVFATNGRVRIGDYTMISYQVVIADGDFPTPGVGGGDGGEIVLGRNAWVGARALLLPGAAIGDDSVLAAGSVLDHPIPAGVLAAGNPARVVRSLRP